MARKNEQKKVTDTEYKSALCALGNAVTTANEWHAEGYDVAYCFAVVANDEDGVPKQAVWMMGRKRKDV